MKARYLILIAALALLVTVGHRYAMSERPPENPNDGWIPGPDDNRELFPPGHSIHQMKPGENFDPKYKDEWKKAEGTPEARAKLDAWRAPAKLTAAMGPNRERLQYMAVIQLINRYNLPSITEPEIRDHYLHQAAADILEAVPTLTDDEVVKLLAIKPSEIKQ
jgi:hypothetical protein